MNVSDFSHVACFLQILTQAIFLKFLFTYISYIHPLHTCIVNFYMILQVFIRKKRLHNHIQVVLCLFCYIITDICLIFYWVAKLIMNTRKGYSWKLYKKQTFLQFLAQLIYRFSFHKLQNNSHQQVFPGILIIPKLTNKHPRDHTKKIIGVN